MEYSVEVFKSKDSQDRTGFTMIWVDAYGLESAQVFHADLDCHTQRMERLGYTRKESRCSR